MNTAARSANRSGVPSARNYTTANNPYQKAPFNNSFVETNARWYPDGGDLL